MPALKFRIDAKEFKQDVKEILDRKIRGITTDYEVYDKIHSILVEYIKSYLPVDTGALRDQGSGYSDKTHYYREGYLEVSKSHGVVWDAYEKRPTKFRHYAQAVIGKVLEIHDGVDGQSIKEAMIENGNWYDFLEECEPILVEAFNRV